MGEKLIAALLGSEDRRIMLARFCEEKGIVLRLISPRELGCTVGYVCGVTGYESAEAKASPEAPKECLIFSGFDGSELQETVAELKSIGLYVPLKAVCTEANLSWTVGGLIGELIREHEYMKQRTERDK